MITAALVCAAVAAALAVPGGLPAVSISPRPRRVGSMGATHRAVVLVTVGAATMLLVLAEGTWLALGLIVLAATLSAGHLARRTRKRKVAEARQERVLELCEVLVGELTAGQPPVSALTRCLDVWPDFEPVPTAARLGADVPTAFRRLAELPGADGLRELAGAWQVSQGSGAGLAVALSHVAVSARESQATRRLVGSEMASAQATARLVAGLPFVALVLGSGIGGDPWGFLLATPAGLVCLAGGLALAFAGLVWIDAIAAGVMSR